MLRCFCGGDVKKHLLGSPGCFRERAYPVPRQVSCEENLWIVDGEVLTTRSLFGQRLYADHGDNQWSRPKDCSSTNSLNG